MRLIRHLLLFILVFSVHAEPIRVGLQTYDPPFSMKVSKENLYSGFEAQFIAEICKRLDEECKYVPTQFKDFFSQLLANNIDLAIGQIGITAARSEQFSFSLPYFISSEQLLTKNNSQIMRPEDLAGKKVGIVRASLARGYLLKKFDEDVSIKEYESSVAVFQALLNNEVDGVLLAVIAENYWIINNQLDTSDFRYIGNPVSLGNGYGIMSNLDIKSIELLRRINQIILDMQQDGTYLRMYSTYF